MEAFKIGDFDTKSTISWALEKCSEKKERFCTEMALNGNLELLLFLRAKGCPWDEETCTGAAKYGHLECLKYAHENRSNSKFPFRAISVQNRSFFSEHFSRAHDMVDFVSKSPILKASIISPN
jgi:hypothetical protein